ncbi:D-glycero-alpha-D-manno-heptose-1,7-bisphosphate 7-phosphatase [Roseisolibacter agri]|uniref:D,D-heptose 1,7-bisphosphate phosphatase n=1 Tax=Roseisolibacter agri TaxID=2014610 RepID=A0AA37QB20_9BACT|nr:HAD family hydrolase [Roseisolibacter agri]GLC26401.1 D,D-heptose 1,7-bisphosphate phosphatase [Roseisolibacter agri]
MRDDTAPLRPAVFLDRDGTLIDDEHYLADPDRVRLRPGAARAVRRLRDAGLAIVVVTNQSGIARGKFTEAEYEAVRARLDELLAAQGATLDASYHCPHHPDFGEACSCRKPGIALFQQAASEHALDLARSAFIGDKYRDVAPAARFGAYGVLVPSPDTPYNDMERARDSFAVATTLEAAAERVLARMRAAGGAS